MLVNSVLGFLSWCKSNGLTLSPVCMVIRVTLKARFTLSVKPILSCESALIKFFSVFVARSAAPVLMSSVRGLISSLSMFFAKLLIIFGYEGNPSIQFFFRDCKKVDENFQKFDDFFCLGWFTYPNYGSFTMSIKYDVECTIRWLHVYYVIYRKKRFVFLVQIWSIPIDWLFHRR